MALPLKSAASTENKLVQGMHAVRATLVQKCPPAPPRTGKAGIDSERMRESQIYSTEIYSVLESFEDNAAQE